MSTNVTLNGTTYAIPAEGDSGWGTVLANYFIAIGSSVLQKSGGTFTLSGEVDFGATYGLKSAYLKSRATNPSGTGIIRIGNTEAVAWRNAGNTSDLSLIVDATDTLVFNGSAITIGGAAVQTAITVSDTSTIDLTLSGANDVSGFVKAASIDNSHIAVAAAIAYSKLSLTGSIVNADVSGSAAIAYSKLNLATSIINADVSASAAIAYSKLNLTGTIVNADVSASAAIAYSKLNLSTSILNADISASAAIAYSKLAALTVSKALVSDGSGVVSASSVTSTELGYVSGVTSAIQTQLGTKVTNPMSASGDIIYGGASGTPTRLAKGSDTQVLTLASGVPSWANAASGFANPMTTGGDIIYGGASGVATRLANGSSGQVLTSAGGTSAPTWSTPSNLAGFRNKATNGDQRFDRRNDGAAQTFTAGAALAYCSDRFYGYCTGANVTGQRKYTATDKYYYEFTGAASVTAIGFGHRIESMASDDLAGQTCTFSVRTANSLLTTVSWAAYYATTTNDTFGTLASPTVTSISSGTFTVTSSMANYSASFSVPSAATTGIEIRLTVGAQTSGTWKITNFQFEAGATATTFEKRHPGFELIECARFLPAFRTTAANERLPMTCSAASTAAVSGAFVFHIPTRVPVTGVVVSAASSFKVVRPSTGSLTASAVAFGSGGMHGANIQWTVTGATTDQVYYLDAVAAGVIYFTGADL